MLDFLNPFIQVLLVVLPALIVFATAYYLLRQLTNSQAKLQILKQQQDRQQAALPIRLQAYERLALFCERVAVPNLVMRSPSAGMNSGQYKLSLLMAIQQEFEHNVTQQVYVSDNLWQIIQVARDDLSRFIDLVSEKVEKDSSAREFTEKLLAYYEQREGNPLQQAQLAIRKEAAALF